ncbi:MAG TPA: hypothetical protein VGZ26_06190, partial [Pirellulales bacterium]|nr:hypothetical protein [Pirellulales bacterium]
MSALPPEADIHRDGQNVRFGPIADVALRALVYQDDVGKVWLTYNDPTWLAGRYGLAAAVAANVEALSKVLDGFAAGAAKSTRL